MRYIAGSDERPNERDVIVIEKTANVYIRENITETEDGFEWVEHHAQLVATPRFEITDTLVEQIKTQDFEIASKEVREKRNALLDESDKEILPDRDTDKKAWAEYRQALRDITEQEGFPYDVVFPMRPY